MSVKLTMKPPFALQIRKKGMDRIILYTSNFCMPAQAIEQFLQDQNLPFLIINIDGNHQARQSLKQLNNGFASVPTLIFPNGTKLVEPTLAQLCAYLGIPLDEAR